MRAPCSRNGTAIVVEVGLTEWRPAGATGYVATYCAARANLEAAAELFCEY